MDLNERAEHAQTQLIQSSPGELLCKALPKVLSAHFFSTGLGLGVYLSRALSRDGNQAVYYHYADGMDAFQADSAA